MGTEYIEHRTGAAGFPHAYVGKSRVRVANIAAMYQSMLDELVVERLLEAYPQLTGEQIAAAIQYWREHPDEIEEDLRRDEEALNSLKSAG